MSASHRLRSAQNAWSILLYSLILSTIPYLPSRAATDQAGSIPNVVKTSPPTYPAMALWAHISGRVPLRVNIAPDGTVISVVVEGGPAMLGTPAALSARQWVFEPDPTGQERTVLLVFDFVGPEATEGDDRLDTRYEPTGLFHITYYQSKIKRLPRVNGATPQQRCELHDQPLLIDVVPIEYGLPMTYRDDGTAAGRRRSHRQDQYRVAHKSLFPNANTYRPGGCAVLFQDRAEMYYCPQCRVARDSWIRHHRWYQEYERTDENDAPE